METPLKIKVIIGSTRQGRFSDQPAHGIYGEAKRKESVDVVSLLLAFCSCWVYSDHTEYQWPYAPKS